MSIESQCNSELRSGDGTMFTVQLKRGNTNSITLTNSNSESKSLSTSNVNDILSFNATIGSGFRLFNSNTNTIRTFRLVNQPTAIIEMNTIPICPSMVNMICTAPVYKTSSTILPITIKFPFLGLYKIERFDRNGIFPLSYDAYAEITSNTSMTYTDSTNIKYNNTIKITFNGIIREITFFESGIYLFKDFPSCFPSSTTKLVASTSSTSPITSASTTLQTSYLESTRQTTVSEIQSSINSQLVVDSDNAGTTIQTTQLPSIDQFTTHQSFHKLTSFKESQHISTEIRHSNISFLSSIASSHTNALDWNYFQNSTIGLSTMDTTRATTTPHTDHNVINPISSKLDWDISSTAITNATMKFLNEMTTTSSKSTTAVLRIRRQTSKIDVTTLFDFTTTSISFTTSQLTMNEIPQTTIINQISPVEPPVIGFIPPSNASLGVWATSGVAFLGYAIILFLIITSLLYKFTRKHLDTESILTVRSFRWIRQRRFEEEKNLTIRTRQF